MRQTLAVERLIPWSDFNEAEAQIDGHLDGHAVICHVLLYGAEWDLVRPGESLEADITFVRYGDVAVVSEPAALINVRGVNYVAIGTVVEREDDLLRVDSVLPLEVDLEIIPGMRRPIPEVAVGDTIRVEGTFEVELLDE